MAKKTGKGLCSFSISIHISRQHPLRLNIAGSGTIDAVSPPTSFACAWRPYPPGLDRGVSPHHPQRQDHSMPPTLASHAAFALSCCRRIRL
ncbi:hypothetical protein BU16DRAFT_239266 [Lophium mytilinum]|uniref:Uncharacterized protein n=1 Tax=Lophium mytilinum TaxID=390894 RepID=A0A6A6R5X7_9PEZI|nr:hypothetical protein BU16DRAFT_239266 [Lophium mytilinum]